MKTHNKITALHFAVCQLVIALFNHIRLVEDLPYPIPKAGLNLTTKLGEGKFTGEGSLKGLTVATAAVEIKMLGWQKSYIQCGFYNDAAGLWIPYTGEYSIGLRHKKFSCRCDEPHGGISFLAP